MSNLCEAPPPKNVDALAAGDSVVTKYKYYFMIGAPCIIWCYVLPAITALIFTREKIWVPVVYEIVEPEILAEEFNDSEQENVDIDGAVAEFIGVNEFDEEIDIFDEEVESEE